VFGGDDKARLSARDDLVQRPEYTIRFEALETVCSGGSYKWVDSGTVVMNP
jgi:hypothetical protein